MAAVKSFTSENDGDVSRAWRIAMECVRLAEFFTLFGGRVSLEKETTLGMVGWGRRGSKCWVNGGDREFLRCRCAGEDGCNLHLR